MKSEQRPAERANQSPSDERISFAPLTFDEALRGLLATDPKVVQEGIDHLRREQGTRRPRKRKTDEDSKKAAPPK